MSYIPPGWTQQRLAAATIDDLSQLPYSTLSRRPPSPHPLRKTSSSIGNKRRRGISEVPHTLLLEPLPRLLLRDGLHYRVSICGSEAGLIARRNRWQVHALPFKPCAFIDAGASSSGAEKQKVDRDPVVQVVEDAGYEEFGFMVVRLDYSDQDAWARWSETFDVPVDRSLAESVGGERIMDKLVLPLVEDAQLEGTGWHGGVSYYKDLRLNSMVQPGLDTSIILVVDKAAVDSLLFPTLGEEPWVWAVDVDFGFRIGDEPPQGEPPTDR